MLGDPPRVHERGWLKRMSKVPSTPRASHEPPIEQAFIHPISPMYVVRWLLMFSIVSALAIRALTQGMAYRVLLEMITESD